MKKLLVLISRLYAIVIFIKLVSEILPSYGDCFYHFTLSFTIGLVLWRLVELLFELRSIAYKFLIRLDTLKQ